MSDKLSDKVRNLEVSLDKATEQLRVERGNGKKDALRFLNSKTKGLMDGGNAILSEFGLDGAASFAAMDRIHDLLKGLIREQV